MKPTDSLFKLIKSLSGSEKGYFKKFSSLYNTGEKNNYLKLFETIDKSSEYDEGKIKKNFQGQVFVKNFANEKNYLYNLVLKSLRNYHSGESADENILERIGSANILYRRGMHKEALIFLDKAKKNAQEFEKYPLVVAIIRFERIIIYSFQSPEKEKKARELMEEETRAIECIEWIRNRNRSYNKLYTFHMESGFARNRQDIQYLNKLVNEPYLKQKNPVYKQYILNLKSLYFFITGDLQKAHSYGKLFIDETTQKFKKQKYYYDHNFSLNYLISLGNFFNYEVEMGKYPEALSTVAKMKGLYTNPFISRSESLQALLFSMCMEELNVHSSMGNFEIGLKAIYSVQAGLEKHEKLIGVANRLNYLLLCATIYFGLEKYDQALVYVNAVLRHPKKETSENNRTFATLFNLVIHFELKNEDLLSSLSRSLYRQLYKKKKKLKIESLLLKFVQSNLRSSFTKGNLIPRFKNLRENILILMKDPFERRILVRFDFISWTESKIKKRTFAEVVKQKAKMPNTST